MPELPEVETIRLALTDRIVGQTIAHVDILHPRIIAPETAENFCAYLQGGCITRLSRRGKYLLWHISRHGEEAGTLVVHLRMTGQIHWLDTPEPLAKHTHLVMDFDSGAQLRYIDIRRFGTWNYYDKSVPIPLPLGKEPLSSDFTAEYLLSFSAGRKRTIKALLMDQNFIAGLGNIYCDEALHRAGIRPETPGSVLERHHMDALRTAIQEVLKDSLAYGGSSMRDYCNIDGKKGMFQEQWRVYHRQGQPCPRCGALIERSVVSGRSSHYCPECQH